MSSNSDPKTVQGAFEAGADDFLFKPLTGLELLTRLSNRLERTRQIAAFSRQTSNAVTGQHNLEHMVMKALRDESEVCLILLSSQDETVATEVQRALKQSLRLDDVIRSYGPLEVIVGMNGVNQSTAQKRLSQILGSHIKQTSAKIASFPSDGRSFDDLLEKAKLKEPVQLPS